MPSAPSSSRTHISRNTSYSNCTVSGFSSLAGTAGTLGARDSNAATSTTAEPSGSSHLYASESNTSMDSRRSSRFTIPPLPASTTGKEKKSASCQCGLVVLGITSVSSVMGPSFSLQYGSLLPLRSMAASFRASMTYTATRRKDVAMVAPEMSGDRSPTNAL